MNWTFLLTITGLAIIGILFGNAVQKKIPASRLRKVFGWFILMMGVYILSRELFLQ
jgi:uncharacterized membrane protein YfcA